MTEFHPTTSVPAEAAFAVTVDASPRLLNLDFSLPVQILCINGSMRQHFATLVVLIQRIP